MIKFKSQAAKTNVQELKLCDTISLLNFTISMLRASFKSFDSENRWILQLLSNKFIKLKVDLTICKSRRKLMFCSEESKLEILAIYVCGMLSIIETRS